MPLMQNRADVTWQGDLMQGSGRLRVASGAFPEQSVTFRARTESHEGQTNPEELIAAAHAVCYSMAFTNTLAKNGTPPQRLDVSATCSLEKTEGGLKVATMDLRVSGDVPGLDPQAFARLAQQAEQACPISNALRGNVEIRLQAQTPSVVASE